MFYEFQTHIYVTKYLKDTSYTTMCVDNTTCMAVASLETPCDALVRSHDVLPLTSTVQRPTVYRLGKRRGSPIAQLVGISLAENGERDKSRKRTRTTK